MCVWVVCVCVCSKGRGKTASKDLRKRKKNYEQELKQRLAVLTQEAKDLDEAEAALKGQRTTLLAHITGAAPPSTTAASATTVGMTFEPAVFEFISQQSKFLLCVITMIFASSMRDWVPAAPSSQVRGPHQSTGRLRTATAAAARPCARVPARPVRPSLCAPASASSAGRVVPQPLTKRACRSCPCRRFRKQLGLAMTRKSMTGSFPTTSSTLSSAAHGRKTRAMACLWKPPRPKLHRHLAPAA